MFKNILPFLSVLLVSSFLGVFIANAETPVESKQAVQSAVKVSLYGNPFTIDPSFIDRANGDRPHSWKNIAYFIPKVLPRIRAEDNEKTVEETLNTISNFTIIYRDLFSKSIRELAERLEKEGHFQILEANETSPSQLKLFKEVLPYAQPQERINALDGAIRVWFRDGSWEQRVEKYNKFKGETVLHPYPFMNPYRFYQYFLALFYLDTVVRGSPEFAVWAKEYRQKKKAG